MQRYVYIFGLQKVVQWCTKINVYAAEGERTVMASWLLSAQTKVKG